MLTSHAALAKDQRNACKPVMEHRHLAVIADIIAHLDEGQRTQIALHFSDKLAETNPKFSRSRFLAACNA